MSRIMVAALLSFIALNTDPSPSDACSIASDYADPPNIEQPFDPAVAPAAPQVLMAEIIHHREQSMGCGGVSSCGDYSGLSLEVQAQSPSGDAVLLRIVHADGSTVYGSGWPGTDGIARLFLPGYADVHDDMPLTVEVIDNNGYPSLAVDTVALVPEGEGGCAVGSSGASFGVFVLLALFATRLRRRPGSGG